MGENRFPCGPTSQSNRDMVAIETNRILDSCRDRDCFEDVKVLLTDFGNEIIQRTTSVRAKDACIAWTNINIEPVRFNRGFYSVNIKFYIKICFEACVGNGRSQEFEGVAILEKRVVLYGSESNVSIFKSSADSSDYCSVPELCCAGKNVPIAVIEACVIKQINKKRENPLFIYFLYSSASFLNAGKALFTIALSVQ